MFTNKEIFPLRQKRGEEEEPMPGAPKGAHACHTGGNWGISEN